MTASHGASTPPGSRLATAALLIGKAQASPFPAEQESLALRAYKELAAYLNSVEHHDGGGRRHERRFLTDRRGRTEAVHGVPVIDLRLGEARTAYRSTEAAGRPPVGAELDLGL